MSSKVCTKCGEKKELEEFSKDSRAKNGKQSKCKVCNKAYREAKKDHISAYKSEWYQANRERVLEQRREYHHVNKECIADYQREYRQANRGRISDYMREYQKERYASDPIFALACRCRNRLHQALNRKGYSKDSTTADMLGCTCEELMAHLESQFVGGMSWDNRSDWHIDHIVPLASAESEEELMALCHYTNLQPLWAEDNISKGARLDWAA